MKKSTITILMFCIFLFSYCGKKSPTTPDIPSYIPPPPTPTASFSLVSSTQGYTSYGCCEITGTIKNVGDATGYNVMIAYQAYNANNVIIDSANGFPAELGNIPVGVSATFEAIFFELCDWGVVDKVTYEITWLTATGVRLTQTGVVF